MGPTSALRSSTSSWANTCRLSAPHRRWQHCSVTPLSTGFVASLATEAADGLDELLDELKARLVSSSLLHVDETFDQVGSEKAWFHVATNELYTYLVASMARGKSAPDDAGVLPEFTGVMVHDRLMRWLYTSGTRRRHTRSVWPTLSETSEPSASAGTRGGPTTWLDCSAR